MTVVSTDAGKRDYDWVVLFLAVAFGLALRLPGLRESLWFDEAYTWLQARDLSIVRTLVLTSEDTYPPLHNLLTLPFLALFGQGEVAYRLPALVLGVLSIPGAYWLGSVSAGRRVGVLAAVLMALAPFAIYYSQEARAYALLMLTALLYSGAILAWLNRPSWLCALGMLAAGAALLYAHPYGAFVLASGTAGGLVAIAADRSGWRRAFAFLGLSTAIALTYAPWLLVTLAVAGRLITEGFWIVRPDLSRAFLYLRSLSGGPLALGLLAAGWILALLPIGGPRPSDDRRRWQTAMIVLACIGFGPLLIGYVVSQVTTPVLVSRYLICSLPALIVLASIGYAKLEFVWTKISLPLVLIATIMAPAVSEARYPRHTEDWRALASYLAGLVEQEDCVVTPGPDAAVPLEYYYGPRRDRCLYKSVADAVAQAANDGRIFAVESHFPGGLDQLQRALPGKWSPVIRFGNSIRLSIREPIAP